MRGTIVIPTSKDGAEDTVGHVEKFFARNLGGFSTYRGEGGWVDDDGTLIREPHARVVVSGDAKKVCVGLSVMADRVKDRLDEDAVFTETIQSDAEIQ